MNLMQKVTYKIAKINLSVNPSNKIVSFQKPLSDDQYRMLLNIFSVVHCTMCRVVQNFRHGHPIYNLW